MVTGDKFRNSDIPDVHRLSISLSGREQFAKIGLIGDRVSGNLPTRAGTLAGPFDFKMVTNDPYFASSYIDFVDDHRLFCSP
jgi:hypothetical protein